jgi:regulator of sigma E protease
MLGVIVLVHEFGHYIAARLTGVRVETFSFGFGKRIFGKKVGETDFRVSLIPMGGYVKMAGEEEYDPNDLKPDEFHAKNRGQKIFILLMGSVMNLLLAFFIFTVINIAGVEEFAYKKESPRIGFVGKGSPAEAAGLREGDIVRTIDGRSIKNWEELEMAIATNPDSEITVAFERDGKILERKLGVKSSSRYSFGEAGISWDFRTEIVSVNKDSPASRAGLKPDDIILAINHKPINFYDLSEEISANVDKQTRLLIKRGEKELEAIVTPQKTYFLESPPIESLKTAEQKLKDLRQKLPGLEFDLYSKSGAYRLISRDLDTRQEAEKYPGTAGLPSPLAVKEKGIIGVGHMPYSPTITTYYGLLGAMKESINRMGNLTFLLFNTFKKMIVGKLSPTRIISGPIEIAKFSRKALDIGISNFIILIAFISLQLGIVNLLPIPALDGGHLMIFSIEAVIRKDFSLKVKGILMNIGFFILIALMAFVILNDVAKNLPNGWNSFWPF